MNLDKIKFDFMKNMFLFKIIPIIILCLIITCSSSDQNNEIEQTNGKTIYILTMLVKRRTNNRHNELHSMMLNFIEQVQSVANMFSSK